MTPARVILGLWVVWALSWFASASWSGATQKSAGLRRELPYRAFMHLGSLLFVIPAHGSEGVLRLWHPGRVGAWVTTALTAVGLAFCWWARVHLGRLWSGNITVKADHRIVDTGPYGLVRHPIYTGLLFALLATAGAKGTVLGVVGAALMIVGFWLKARLEEAWLRTELGAEAYDAYRTRVPMLVPFGPRG